MSDRRDAALAEIDWRIELGTTGRLGLGSHPTVDTLRWVLPVLRADKALIERHRQLVDADAVRPWDAANRPWCGTCGMFCPCPDVEARLDIYAPDVTL